MIAKKTPHSSTFLQRLLYILRGKDTEHDEKNLRANHDHRIEHIDIINANFSFEDPLHKNNDGTLFGVDLHRVYDIDLQFEEVSGRYKGNGNKFCGHFVLSLAEGESLDKSQWQHAIKIFMEEHGYQNNKFLAVRHKPKDSNTKSDDKKEHIHLIVQRVRDDNYTFVKESNDYRKNENACRKIEKLFNLQKVLSSDETWNSRPTKAQEQGIKKRQEQNLKEGKDLNDGLKESDIPIMKALLKDIIDNKRPKTMSEFVNLLEDVNIKLNVKTKNGGYEIKGVTYQYNNGQEIAGKSLHRHKCTWPKLQDNGINYKPSRDNEVLDLGEYVISNYKPRAVKKKDITYKPADTCPALLDYGEEIELNFYAMLRIKANRANREYVKNTNNIYKKGRAYFVAMPINLKTLYNRDWYTNAVHNNRKSSNYISSRHWREIRLAMEIAEQIMNLIKSLLKTLGIIVEIVPTENLEDNFVTFSSAKQQPKPKKLNLDDIGSIQDYAVNDIKTRYNIVHKLDDDERKNAELKNALESASKKRKQENKERQTSRKRRYKHETGNYSLDLEYTPK